MRKAQRDMAEEEPGRKEPIPHPESLLKFGVVVSQRETTATRGIVVCS